MSDLDEHIQRVDWVRNEIAGLEAEVEAYVQSKPIQVYWHYDLAPRLPSRLYRMRLTHNVPIGIQIRTGTVINEMRAILDALACALVRRTGEQDVSGTYFATGKTKEIYENEARLKHKKISDADRAVLATLRPYPGGNDLLYALHSTDVIRKHQRLIVLAGVVGETAIGKEGGWSLDSRRFMFIKAGEQELSGEPIAQSEHDYHLEIQQNAVVAFSEPDAIKAKPVIAVLYDFARTVDSILKLFV